MTQDRTTCNEFMELASRGDDGAFGLLAQATQDALYRFGLAHGLKAGDSAEVVQETFLRAFRSRKAWRAGGDAMGWLYGIAINVTREFHRKNHRRPTEGLELDNMAEDQCDRPGRAGGGYSDQPEAILSVAIRNQTLIEALDKLPPRQREAVSCRFLLDMSLKETADIMGCAEGTVKAAVFAGLQNLRKLVSMQDI
ncbi:MAG: RNA polymerase sigma factor [Planctomycetaceae bacterium]|nr:MAG: RNA polymerase sigma factor [Planctomycetaceae bacterium]